MHLFPIPLYSSFQWKGFLSVHLMTMQDQIAIWHVFEVCILAWATDWLIQVINGQTICSPVKRYDKNKFMILPGLGKKNVFLLFVFLLSSLCASGGTSQRWPVFMWELNNVPALARSEGLSGQLVNVLFALRCASTAGAMFIKNNFPSRAEVRHPRPGAL